MMPDNWGFVLAAYGLAAVALIGYWRMLVRQESDLEDRSRLAPSSGHPTPGSQATSAREGERSHAAPISGHPRSKPGSRTSIQ